jgi:hypothetical protein
MANYVHSPYRNAVVGKTSDYVYSTVLTNFATTIFSAFSDEADAATAATDVFQSVWTAGETPAFAVRLALASVTSGSVATGVVDAADPVFTGAAVLPAGDPVENYFVFKYITNAAASPNLAHWDTATGLPLTPNGADVTVAISASGLWKF